MVKSGFAIWLESKGVELSKTRAARMEVVMQMLYPKGIDENGEVVELTPLITNEQALELLNMGSIDPPK